MYKQAKYIALISFILIFISLFTAFFMVDRRQNNQAQERYLEHESMHLETTQKDISNRIYTVLADLEILANQVASYGEDQPQLIRDLWQNFVVNKGIYDQVRYIDASGQEIYRIDYINEEAVVVETDQLQNKKDRYYVRDTMALEADQYYISQLDLNVEKGLVEIPYQPMLRFSKPVYHQGQVVGMVVVNFLAGQLLDTFEDSSQHSNSQDHYFLNAEGYWLVSTDSSFQEWGFMFDTLKTERFSEYFPDVWEQIISLKRGYTLDETGIYTFMNVLPYEQHNHVDGPIELEQVVLGEGNWYLVSHIEKDNEAFTVFTCFDDYLLYLIQHKLYELVLILVFSILLVAFIRWYIANRIKDEYMYKYDQMTEAYNRQYGFKIGQIIYDQMLKRDVTLGLIYCDINQLKFINDQYGHESGDLLIKTFAQAVTETIRWHHMFFIGEKVYKWLVKRFPSMKQVRDNDVFIRLGGDEFLLMFVKTDYQQLESIWQRIENALRDKQIYSHKISASHGSVLMDGTIHLTFEEAVNTADHLMYTDKKNNGYGR